MRNRSSATLEQARDEGEQVLTGPIALCFVRASRAFLSPQYAAGNARESVRPEPEWKTWLKVYHCFNQGSLTMHLLTVSVSP